MYKYFYETETYNDANKEQSVGLHDCKATKIELQAGKLSFYFPDGFWIGKKENDGRKVFYTGEAQVEFFLLYPDDVDVTFYIFSKENGKTIREEYTVEDFIKLVNEKKYRLEFLYEYIGYMSFKYDCWLWFDEEPYHKECEIIITAKKAIYRWNEMYEEES